jgi:hypothetical protein
MTEVLEMIDTEVNAVDVHELIDAELDTVSGGYNWASREQFQTFLSFGAGFGYPPSGMVWGQVCCW